MGKRGNGRLLTLLALAVGGLFTIAIAAWGVAFSYSERDKYEAVGHQGSGSDAQDTEVQTGCLNETVPQSIADCVRKEETARYKQEHDDADLHAQQDMAAFAHGLMWFGAFSFVTSGWGFVALIWTFNEQRKLAQNQSRAYLELITAHYSAARYASIDEGEDTEDSIYVTLTLRNNSETPALHLKTSLTFHCMPGTSGESGGEPYAISNISGELQEIPAKGTYVLRAYGTGVLPQDAAEKYGWRYRGPEIRVSGKITFEDVFGTPNREMEIELGTTSIHEMHRPPVEFDGPHRNRDGADRMLSHQRAWMEKHLADAAKDVEQKK